MARQIAFLRAVNVGSHNRIGMARLCELFRGLGCRDVQTYLQSGNVVFTSPGTRPEQTAQRIEERILLDLGLDVRVLVRTGDELASIVAGNPFGEIAFDPAKLLVTFLSATPDPGLIGELDPTHFEPDLFRVAGREIYLWCPNGVRDTKFTNAFVEKRLRVTGTARNWNTVTNRLVMAQ